MQAEVAGGGLGAGRSRNRDAHLDVGREVKHLVAARLDAVQLQRLLVPVLDQRHYLELVLRILKRRHRLEQRAQYVRLLPDVRQEDGERRKVGIVDRGQRPPADLGLQVGGGGEHHLEADEDEVERLAGSAVDRDHALPPAPDDRLAADGEHRHGDRHLL